MFFGDAMVAVPVRAVAVLLPLTLTVLPVQAEAEVAAEAGLIAAMVVVMVEKIVPVVRLIADNASYHYRFKQLLFVPALFAVEALPATPMFKVVQINAAVNTIAVMLTRRLLYNQYKTW